MIAVAAAGSVGETIAPSAKAIAHGRSISSWPMTATATVVAMTRPIADRAMTRALSRSERRSPKNADE